MRSRFQHATASSRRPAGAAIATTALAVLAACGGSESSTGAQAFTTPLVVTNAAAGCAALAGRTFGASLIGEPTAGAIVTSATYKPAVPDRPNAANTAIVPATPDYCEVLVDIAPVDPSAPKIKSQVNLPTSWNGKKLQFGGGGYNGVLITGVQPSRNAPPDVPMPLTRGYMTAGTDSGHQTSGSTIAYAFALNAEALVNYAHASYKKTHDVAVQLGLVFYGQRPLKSYYLGASEGGREGMMMAQRYPNDFDGIVAIDPVMNFTALQHFGNHAGGVLQSKPGAWLQSKVQLVHDTVKAACDAADGIADGVVSNYRSCRPMAIAALAAKRCAGGADEGATCFSEAQLAAINGAYTGYTFKFPLANGVTSYAGLNFGSEGLAGAWDRWVTGTVAPTSAGMSDPNASRLYQFGNGFIRYFIAQDPALDPLAYDPSRFQARVQQVSGLMDATSPDLGAFQARGGKLILREDLSDAAQSPLTGLNYWESVVARMGQATVDGFFAAYVATGLPHTSPGIAAGSANAPAYGIPGSVDLLPALEDWVEKGIRPGQQFTLVNKAALPPYGTVVSKPMCRYGLYPRFIGTDPAAANQAGSYSCVAN
jgi:pimeloyl-ACP methyl ester carboxylesterase